MTCTIDQMIASEVLVCMSSLVSTLAQAGQTGALGRDLTNLIEHAQELAMPVDDYEEAAIQAGAIHSGGMWSHDDHPIAETTATTLCIWMELEPVQSEVYEHWAVSSWLADKLEAAGEKVDRDFAGLCIWARTTTGQSIAADGVIQRIYAETHTGLEG